MNIHNDIKKVMGDENIIHVVEPINEMMNGLLVAERHVFYNPETKGQENGIYQISEDKK